MTSFMSSSSSSYIACPSWIDADCDLGIINTDQMELFSALDEPSGRTLLDDIQLIESSASSSQSSDDSETSEIYDPPKYEIRNRNCMWSGLCSNNLNSLGMKHDDMDSQASDLDMTCIKMEATQLPQQLIQPASIHQPTVPAPAPAPAAAPATLTPNTTITNTSNNMTTLHNMQNVPAGTSLLKSNQQKKKSVRPQPFVLPTIASPFVSGRPDTPLSLDDDTPEFKHSVDLAACIMGSNNIPLDDEKVAIDKLREQLEDPNTSKIFIPGKKERTLTEVEEILDDIQELQDHQNSRSSDGNETDSEFDFEDDDEYKNSSIYSASPDTMTTSSTISYPVMHSDHSYTRCKDGIVDVTGNGMETPPSESDEEIDVVSIGDKKLPTNPSDKDRRALQTKVAHKISARVVKTAKGLRTIPPRRRISDDVPYTPMSISPTKSGSSLASSRYTSPADTPVYSSSSHLAHASNPKYYPNGNGVVRKRSSGAAEYMPPNKRHRAKKQKQPSPAKRHYSADEADTIEKRNLHNDMERQRRIGLKNLFEALKKQIPSIKDKERAPKVNILREAAKLCEQLTRDEQILYNKQQILAEQLVKRRELLNRLKLLHSKRLE